MDPAKVSSTSIEAPAPGALEGESLQSSRMQWVRTEAELQALPGKALREAGTRMFMRGAEFVRRFAELRPEVSNDSILSALAKSHLELGVASPVVEEMRPRLCARISELVEMLAPRCADIGLPARLASDGLLADLAWYKHQPDVSLMLGNLWPTGRPDRLLHPIKEVSGIALSISLDRIEAVCQSITGLVAGVDSALSDAFMRKLQENRSAVIWKWVGKIAQAYRELGGTEPLGISDCEFISRSNASDQDRIFIVLTTQKCDANHAVTHWRYGDADSYGIFCAIAKYINHDCGAEPGMILSFPMRQDLTEELALQDPFPLTQEQKISFLHCAAEALREVCKTSQQSIRPLLPLILLDVPNSRRFWAEVLAQCHKPSPAQFLCRTLGLEVTATGIDATGMMQGMFATFRTATLAKRIFDQVAAPGYQKAEELGVTITGVRFQL